MMNKIDCEDLNRWQTVKRGRYGAAPIKILQGKKIHHKQKITKKQHTLQTSTVCSYNMCLPESVANLLFFKL